MDKALLFIFLAVFPFGQLLGHWPIDIVVGLIFLYTILSRPKRSKAFKIFGRFVVVAIFSYLFSFLIFKNSDLTVGALYLFRLVSYWFFLDFCVNLIKKHPKIKPVLFKSLVAIAVAIAIFGWIQYFFYPDLTALKYLGWDDHLYRLVGTFLDPGFTSLFMVLGAVASFMVSPIISVFLIISLAFTYSRAGYLAFVGATVAMGILTRNVKTAVLFIVLLLGVIIFLPKPAGEGVNLARTYSVTSRLQNYTETIKIFKESPLYGIGFNNMCLAKQIYLGKEEPLSHSCSGSDSSLLFILAATGIVGLLAFVYSIKILFKFIKRERFFNILTASSVALFIHSLFTNSIFYPFIMGYFAILISLQNFKENT